ncbi:MAG: 4Fe-4S dicluster domain-containing protein [Thermodesulfobacteriota bacterium]
MGHPDQNVVQHGAAGRKLAQEIMARPGGEHLSLCFACGTCTLACPVAEVTETFNPRRIIRQILLGRGTEVLDDPAIWLCHQCFRCAVHCPQGVSFTTIMRILQGLAQEQGRVTPRFVAALHQAEQEIEALRTRVFAELAAHRQEEAPPEPAELVRKATAAGE